MSRRFVTFLLQSISSTTALLAAYLVVVLATSPVVAAEKMKSQWQPTDKTLYQLVTDGYDIIQYAVTEMPGGEGKSSGYVQDYLLKEGTGVYACWELTLYERYGKADGWSAGCNKLVEIYETSESSP